MRFKIDWDSLILGRKFTVFLCFTLYFMAISKYKPPPPWGLYLEGRFLTEVFLRYEFWGAYIWRGLYMEGLMNDRTDKISIAPLGMYFYRSKSTLDSL